MDVLRGLVSGRLIVLWDGFSCTLQFSAHMYMVVVTSLQRSQAIHRTYCAPTCKNDLTLAITIAHPFLARRSPVREAHGLARSAPMREAHGHTHTDTSKQTGAKRPFTYMYATPLLCVCSQHSHEMLS